MTVADSTTTPESARRPPGLRSCFDWAVARLREDPRPIAISIVLAGALLLVAPVLLERWLAVKPTFLPSNVLPVTLAAYVGLAGLWASSGVQSQTGTPRSTIITYGRSAPFALIAVVGYLGVNVGLLFLFVAVAGMGALGIVLRLPISLLLMMAFGFVFVGVFASQGPGTALGRGVRALRRQPLTTALLTAAAVGSAHYTAGLTTQAWLARTTVTRSGYEVPSLVVRSLPEWHLVVGCLALSATALPLSWLALAHLYRETAA